MYVQTAYKQKVCIPGGNGAPAKKGTCNVHTYMHIQGTELRGQCEVATVATNHFILVATLKPLSSSIATPIFSYVCILHVY